MTIVMILLIIPILLGIAAGIASDSLPAAALSAGIALALGVVSLLTRARSRAEKPRDPGTAPAIVSASYDLRRSLGALTVEARNSKQVLDALRIPHGARVETVERGSLYRVTFLSTLVSLTQTARAYGFRGRVEMLGDGDDLPSEREFANQERESREALYKLLHR